MARVITPVEAEGGRYSLALGMETHVPITTTNNNLDEEAPGWR